MSMRGMNGYFKQVYKMRHLSKRSFTFTNKQSSETDSLSYCTNLVRQHDYENFLATLLMTKAIRSPALVIRAFNVEIAKIQDQTTDIQTAAFRLKFWQDVIADIYTKDQIIRNIPAHPVAQELLKVCSYYHLPRRHFEKLITSRSSVLTSRFFRSLEDVERYADSSVSSIYYLLLSIAAVENVHADHAASHLGKAQGIANILRSIYVTSRHKMVSLPMDILMKYNINQESVLRGTDCEEMRNVTFEVASRANSHLEKARSIGVPKISKQIFLPAISVDSYLKKLEKCNFNIFDTSLQIGNPVLPFRLYYKRLTNKY